MDLKGKNCLITGGAKRIGKAIALALAEKGCHIAFTYLTSSPEAMETAKEIERLGVSCHPLQVDLGNVENLEPLVAQIEQELGSIDILINNASRFEPSPWPNISNLDWDADLNINLKAPFFLCQAIGPKMVQSGEGKIINIADGSLEKPYLSHLPYSIAKTGLITLTKAMAQKLAPQVQVMAIAPGPILFPEGSSSTEQQSILEQTPLKRPGSPEDISSAVLFLLEGSDYITGHTLFVDGGRFL